MLDRRRALSEEAAGSPEEAKRRAMKILLYRDRSEKELYDRLSEIGFEEEAIREAMEYVASFGYLNDARYAENYVASFAGQKSRRAITQALRERGVDEVLIEDALEALPEDESEVIGELIRRRVDPEKPFDERAERRIVMYLARRGYRDADIRRAVRAYKASRFDKDGESV